MAKILILNDTTNLPLNFQGDIIAVFEDDHKWGSKEEEHIRDGLFAVVDVTGKADDVKRDMENGHPKMKRMWQDTDGTWKEVNNEPKAWFRWDGGIVHNIRNMTDNNLLANQAIKDELDTTKAELVTTMAELDKTKAELAAEKAK